MANPTISEQGKFVLETDTLIDELGRMMADTTIGFLEDGEYVFIDTTTASRMMQGAQHI